MQLFVIVSIGDLTLNELLNKCDRVQETGGKVCLLIFVWSVSISKKLIKIG